MIRKIRKQDWPSIKKIYIEGIETDMATLTVASDVKTYEEWISSKIPQSCMLFEKENLIQGWAALSPVSKRSVYSGVAEVSIYVDSNCYGQGLGSKLMDALISFAESNDIWTLQSSIFPENKSSHGLHEKFGFRTVGYREKIGHRNGRWRDTLILERRSKLIGL